MRRAAVAIPSNIAEGQKRAHRKEFIQFLYVSYGSGAELETQLEIAGRLYKGNDVEYTAVGSELESVMKMLDSLISALKKEM